VGTRLGAAEAYQAFTGLVDVVPRPDHRPSGEERAWARRLAKRFGSDGRLDDRTFVIAGDGSLAGGLDFAAPKVKLAEGTHELFTGVDAEAGARLVAFGWAMAEDLAAAKIGR